MRISPWRLPLLIVAGVCTCSAFAQDGTKPKLNLSQKAWDFGEVWHADRPKLDLILKNEGGAELRIQKVHTSCGCTAAQPEKMVLAPGESTPVHVVFDTKGKQGPVSSKVIVFSNDPGQAQATLDIKGVVKRAVTMEPQGGLFVRALDPNGSYSCTVRLKNFEAEPMKLAIKQNNAPGWDFQINEITPNLEYEVVATIRGPLQAGTTKGSLLLSTGLKREPNFNIPVRVTIYGRIELVPRAFMFLKEDADPAKRSASVEYYGTAEDFNVTDVTVSIPEVKAKIGNRRPGPKSNVGPTAKWVIPVQLEVPPGKELPPENVMVQIMTNDPDYPILDVVITTNSDVYQAVQHNEKPLPRRGEANK